MTKALYDKSYKNGNMNIVVSCLSGYKISNVGYLGLLSHCTWAYANSTFNPSAWQPQDWDFLFALLCIVTTNPSRPSLNPLIKTLNIGITLWISNIQQSNLTLYYSFIPYTKWLKYWRIWVNILLAYFVIFTLDNWKETNSQKTNSQKLHINHKCDY